MQPRRLKAEGFDELAVSPVRLQDDLTWCDEVAVDPSVVASRSRNAGVVGLRGGAVGWPRARRRAVGVAAGAVQPMLRDRLPGPRALLIEPAHLLGGVE